MRSDGLLRDYVLKTPYGEFTMCGDAMLLMRLNHLHALSLLEKVSGSQSFAQALAQAGLNQLKYTGQLIISPIGTVKNTFAGIGAIFQRLDAGLRNAGKTPDNLLANVLGVTQERRQLAAAYGIDPYTDFPPLDAKVKQLSEAAALGGLAVTDALLAVPGAAGIVVSNLSTANKLNNIGIDDLARRYTAAQIIDRNRDRLSKMGVPVELTQRLLANPSYTPIDMAAMAATLDSMRGVENRAVNVGRAAEVNHRLIAYYMRKQAELVADDYRRHGGYVRFVALAGYPFVLTRDRHIVMLAPIDALFWTAETSAGFGEMTTARRGVAPKDRGELRITGDGTRQAQARGGGLDGEGTSVAVAGEKLLLL